MKLKSKYPAIKISFRGLSTSRSFLNVHKKNPIIIKDLVKAGLDRVGFGIDGATPCVYKQTKKPQTVQESLDAIDVSKRIYDITPEILMVFGHNNIEDEHSLKLALEFCKNMLNKYGAYPRPHIAKDIVPGNDGWIKKENRTIKNVYISNPILFQNLDYTAIPSLLTHPNNEFRNLVIKYYKMVCKLPKSLTEYVLPYSANMSTKEFETINKRNLGKYDI